MRRITQDILGLLSKEKGADWSDSELTAQRSDSHRIYPTDVDGYVQLGKYAEPERNSQWRVGEKPERSSQWRVGEKPERSSQWRVGEKPERSSQWRVGEKPERSSQWRVGEKPERSSQWRVGEKPERSSQWRVGEKPERSSQWRVGEEPERSSQWRVGEEPERSSEWKVGEELERNSQCSLGEEPERSSQWRVGEKPERSSQWRVGEEPERSSEWKVGEELERNSQCSLGEEPERSSQWRVDEVPERSIQWRVGEEPERTSPSRIGEETDRRSQWRVCESPERSNQWRVGEDPERSSQWNVGEEPERSSQLSVGEDQERSSQWRFGEEPERSSHWRVGEDPERSSQWRFGEKPEISSQWRVGEEPERSSQWRVSEEPERSSQWRVSEEPERSSQWRVGEERGRGSQWWVDEGREDYGASSDMSYRKDPLFKDWSRGTLRGSQQSLALDTDNHVAGENVEPSLEDLELLRKKMELEIIQEQIARKKASQETHERQAIAEDQSMKKDLDIVINNVDLKEETLKVRVNNILRKRAWTNECRLKMPIDHPPKVVKSFLERMNESILHKDGKERDYLTLEIPEEEHPLKLKVEALIDQRRNPTMNKKDTEATGFQRFLDVLNKGVDIEKLSSIVNNVNGLPSVAEHLRQDPQTSLGQPKITSEAAPRRRSRFDEFPTGSQCLSLLQLIALDLGVEELGRLTRRTQERLSGMKREQERKDGVEKDKKEIAHSHNVDQESKIEKEKCKIKTEKEEAVKENKESTKVKKESTTERKEGLNVKKDKGKEEKPRLRKRHRSSSLSDSCSPKRSARCTLRRSTVCQELTCSLNVLLNYRPGGPLLNNIVYV
ncbi:hypothetical protein UPYG_G00066830 [Umbra pygmaea]|uniref:Uncharacterized protein n=1 Tax=Umbra pygmaea TaxID=75934 RepID=A0ABD0XEA9_UMBPY